MSHIKLGRGKLEAMSPKPIRIGNVAPGTDANDVVTKAQLDAASTGGGGSTTKIFKALVSQVGTSNPTVVVLENTLGFVPVLAYQGTGTFSIEGDGIVSAPFPFAKTFFQITNKSQSKQFAIDRSGFQDDNMYIMTFNGSGTLQNGLMSTVPLLIEIYP